jgi:CheY-like chemotaxis protein
LATVYGIVQQHEGWIDIHSEPGQGTTFRVYLPRHATTEAEAAAGTGLRKLPGGTETVLLVDDQDIVRGVGQALLEHLGYTVLIARDGLEGVEVYARERERIDLVVMDLTMPRMSGMEALPLLRLLNPTVPVLISSGHDEETYAPECLRLGAVGFVAKPYRIATMAQAVRSALDQAAA